MNTDERTKIILDAQKRLAVKLTIITLSKTLAVLGFLIGLGLLARAYPDMAAIGFGVTVIGIIIAGFIHICYTGHLNNIRRNSR